VVWSLANPLLLLAVYLLVFSLLWKVTGPIQHYPLYLVTGLTAWVFFSTALTSAARSLLEHGNLIRKTRFPRQLVPLSVVATQAVTFGIMLAIVAALCVVLRDVEHLVGAVLLPWFFLTPILYSFDQLPGFQRHHALVQVLYYGNPITPGIEALRAPLWAGELPSAVDTIYLVVAATAALALGAWVFTRLDDRIAVEL